MPARSEGEPKFSVPMLVTSTRLSKVLRPLLDTIVFDRGLFGREALVTEAGFGPPLKPVLENFDVSLTSYVCFFEYKRVELSEKTLENGFVVDSS